MTDQPTSPVPVFTGNPITVDTAQCINQRTKQVTCTRCVDGCPVDAIQLAARQPQLDADACVRCGACLHDCPTQVFTQPRRPENRLMRVIIPLPDVHVAVVCPVHPAPPMTRTPTTVVVQHTRCLAGLDVEEMIAACQEGQRQFWVDDTPCNGCPLHRAQIAIGRSVAAANTLLGVRVGTHAGHPAVHLATAIPTERGAASPKRRPLLDGSQPKISRRGLLTGFGTLAPTDPEELESDHQDSPAQVRAADRLGHSVPVARQQLLECMQGWSLAQAEQVSTAALPIAAVEIAADACSACALCVQFCPTGALHQETKEGHFLLSFTPSICVDCTICVAACPEHAVTLGDLLPAVALQPGASTNLVDAALGKCAGCGAPTAQRPQDGPALCHVCRQGAGIVRPLHDGAGLIAGLLQQEQRLAQRQSPPSLSTADQHSESKP